MRAALAVALFAACFVLPPAARAACPDPENDVSVEVDVPPVTVSVPKVSVALPEIAVPLTPPIPAALGMNLRDSDDEDADDEDEDQNTVPQPDTTFSVRPGTALEIENFGGSIEVRTWDKDAIKIAADHSLRDRVMIVRTGSAIRFQVKSRRWVPASVRYRIVAPRWMKLELSGVNTDIDVTDSRGEIRAETVQGDITVRGATGYCSLSSVQGAILVQDVRGRVESSSVNEKVRLTNVVGPIYAESVNGGIEIEGAHSDSVEASTVNGPVTFEGQITDGGYYRFATHNGCIDVAMPEKSSATLSLSTFSGGIDSSFPVTLKKIRSKHFETTLGTGRAKFEMESFQGTIYLRRPGEARASCDAGSDDDSDQTAKAEHEKIQKKEKVQKQKIQKKEKSEKDPDEDDE